MSDRENAVQKAAKLFFHNSQIFMAVCEHRSVTQAAKALGITAGAVSQVLSQLEKATGADLFDKSRRPWSITPKAHALYQEIRLANSRLTNAVGNLRSESNLPDTVRIGIIESINRAIGTDFVIELLEHLHQVIALSSPSEILFSELENSKVDFIIVSDPFLSKMYLTRRLLFTEDNVVLYPKSLRLPHSELTLESFVFSGLPVIRAPAHGTAGAFLESVFKELSTVIPNRIEVESTATLAELVAAGVGWSIQQPLCALANKECMGKISLTTLGDSLGHREVWLIARDSASPAALKVIEETFQSVMTKKALPELKEAFPGSEGYIRL